MQQTAEERSCKMVGQCELFTAKMLSTTSPAAFKLHAGPL